MEDLFGKSGVGSAPSGTICSTPLFNTTSSQTKSSIAQATGSQEQPLPEEQPGPSTAMPSKEMHRRRQTTSTFCEVYEAHSERRTAALESLVRPDLERRRRLKERRRRMFEKKYLTCLGEIIEQLKKISKSQEMIIDLLKNKV